LTLVPESLFVMAIGTLLCWRCVVVNLNTLKIWLNGRRRLAIEFRLRGLRKETCS